MKSFFRRKKIFTIYSTETCSYCQKAKDLLGAENIDFIEIKLKSTEDLNHLANKLGYTPKTVPQIWKHNTHIGGYDDLMKHLNGQIA